MGMLLMSAQILDPFQKFPSYWKCDKGMNINPEDKICYTTQYQKMCLKSVENEYCTKLWCVAEMKPESIASNNLFSSATALGSSQSSIKPYNLSWDDDKYITPDNVAETTPRQSDRAAHFFNTARLYLNSSPEVPKSQGEINPILNDYHSNAMEIHFKCWISDITNRWHQQGNMHSKYTNLSDERLGQISIIPHGFGVGASLSLGYDVIGWRQSITTV